MNELWPYISFILGTAGVIIWWLGRGWITHVMDALEKLSESDRRLHEKYEQDKRTCQQIHLRIEHELGLLRGKVNGNS